MINILINFKIMMILEQLCAMMSQVLLSNEVEYLKKKGSYKNSTKEVIFAMQ